MTDLPINLPSPSASASRTSANVLSTTRFENSDSVHADPTAFRDAMVQAQGSAREAAAPPVSDTGTANPKGGDDDRSDVDAPQGVESTVLPPAPPMSHFIPAPASAPLSELPSALNFTPMTRTGTLQAGASQTMALAGVAELSPSAGVGPLGELVFSDVLADQTPLRPGALSAPMTSTATLPTQTQTDAVSTRVGERGWDQGLGDKLVWMTSQKRQVAELSLNPPELGPLKITIRLDQNQASAQFVSAHASVREAIESAMPKLREMLAESGITLGNASVGTEGFREPAQQQQAGVHPTQTIAHLMGTGTLASGERQLQRARGLVDTFA